MTKTERWLESQGFVVIGTGGNCSGWSSTSRSGTELLVAAECGHKIRESDYRKGFVGGQTQHEDPVTFLTFAQLQRWVRKEIKR